MKTGYIKDDLMVIYHYFDSEKPNEERFKKTYANNNYSFMFVLKGVAKARNGANEFEIKENQIMLIDVHNAFGYEFISEDYECLYVTIHPTVISDKDADDKKFTRVFEGIPVEECVVDCENEGLDFVSSCVDSIKRCIFAQLGRTHILPRIKAIISEICMYYDKKYDVEANATDSLAVLVYKYVNRNYLEDITYQTLMDEFFISKPIINKIMHDISGTTLRKYIEQLRLNDANNMIRKGLELNKVAQMCGFKSYSTFYRAYTKTFGQMPKNRRDG